MTYPLFKRFHDAMDAEMVRHAKLGDKSSWVTPTQVVTITGAFADIRREITTAAYLEEVLQAAFDEYWENPTQDQLVDVANLCAMLYLHGEGAVE